MLDNSTLRDWREQLSTPEAAESMEQTDCLCPECQLKGRDHNYLFETTDRDGNDTYCCPVCEKTYPVAEWLMLMAEAYAKALDGKEDYRRAVVGLEYELRTAKMLVLELAEAIQGTHPGLYERAQIQAAGNLGPQ